MFKKSVKYIGIVITSWVILMFGLMVFQGKHPMVLQISYGLWGSVLPFLFCCLYYLLGGEDKENDE